MRLSDKLAKFIMNDIKSNEKDEYPEELEDEKIDKGTEKKEKIDEELKTKKEEKKKSIEEKRLEKAKNKISKLYDALTQIKEQLEDKKLSPFKRLILQLKLNLIETRLDRQLAKFELKEFKEKMDEIKDQRINELNSRIEPMKAEYDAILDRKFEVEEEIEDLLYNIDEREAVYGKINNTEQINKSNDDAEQVYVYRVNDDIREKLIEKQRELESIISQKEEKEDEIIGIKDEFQEMIKRIEETKNNKLMKYNPLVMTWGTVRTFFERAGKTIKNWISERRNEKQEVKEAMNKAKEETTEKFREQALNESNSQNDKTVERIENEIEAKEDLKDIKENDRKEEKEEKEKTEIETEEIEKTEDEEPEKIATPEEDNRNADELTAELITRIRNREDTAGLPQQIVERITKEAQENAKRTSNDFKNSLKSDKTYEEQKEFVEELQEQKEDELEEELDPEYDENQFTQEELDAVEISPNDYMMRTSVNKEKMEELLRKGEADRRRRIKGVSKKESNTDLEEKEFSKEEIRTIQNNAKYRFAKKMHNNAIENLKYRIKNSQDEEEKEELQELIDRHKESIERMDEKIIEPVKKDNKKDIDDESER